MRRFESLSHKHAPSEFATNVLVMRSCSRDLHLFSQAQVTGVLMNSLINVKCMTFVNNVSLGEGTRVSGWLYLVHCGITI